MGLVVYSVTCKCSECDQEYIGETARMLGTRFGEHTDGKHLNSAIAEHISSTDHRGTLDDTKNLVREKWFPRKSQEALHIHKRSPALNQDPVTSHCTIIKDHVTCSKRLGMFQTCV